MAETRDLIEQRALDGAELASVEMTVWGQALGGQEKSRFIAHQARDGAEFLAALGMTP